MLRSMLISLVVCSIAVTAAYGEYTLTPKVGGAGVVKKDPGESFTIDFLLTSDANDVCTSAVLEVGFSRDGLRFDSYAWGSPFETGGWADGSDPSPEMGPLLNSGDLISGNVYFDNFVETGEYSTGVLLALTLTIPSDFPAVGSVAINVLPHPDLWFENDSGPVSARRGTDLIVQVPEPATMSLLVLGALALMRPRRS